jgi:hypothetical protein
MNDGIDARSDSDSEYISYGYFDPLLARRIIKRFAEVGVRFDAADTSRIDMADAGIVGYETPLHVTLFSAETIALNC